MLWCNEGVIFEWNYGFSDRDAICSVQQAYWRFGLNQLFTIIDLITIGGIV
ncbi:MULTISPECIES: hypothetical protein [Planktothricoides]|uniref:Uncharacterized protein n=2 Tax=Planktothricoides raciborskii TaxID=132608 RepID=A0AAU8J8M5_9CYAN|nr:MULTISPECIES: hypothetical protein [Planktothricoides]MBD2544703.1 hypothetical protein [Planktothricoides raciborskii FACHB-1370]MBD2580786.1 hypothetical protein [Planktothricoides raciborskii FACHB-1261]